MMCSVCIHVCTCVCVHMRITELVQFCLSPCSFVAVAKFHAKDLQMVITKFFTQKSQ